MVLRGGGRSTIKDLEQNDLKIEAALRDMGTDDDLWRLRFGRLLKASKVSDDKMRQVLWCVECNMMRSLWHDCKGQKKETGTIKEYEAWLGDALVALDVRKSLGRLDADAFVKFTSGESQASWLRSHHPEECRGVNGQLASKRALSTRFEQLYWCSSKFRENYLNSCFTPFQRADTSTSKAINIEQNAVFNHQRRAFRSSSYGTFCRDRKITGPGESSAQL